MALPITKRKEKRHYELIFSRTKSGLEVDFILHGRNIFYVIKVKTSARLCSKML
jgi:hypothetical protein